MYGEHKTKTMEFFGMARRPDKRETEVLSEENERLAFHALLPLYCDSAVRCAIPCFGSQ